jgi:very-short-patch-repair endonuclease
MFDIQSRIDGWRQLLLDTSKRNRLVSFRSGRGGGLDLVSPPAAALWDRLLAGGKFTFPWKRDLLGLPAEVIDADRLAEDPPTDADPHPPLAQDFTALCLRSDRLRPDHLLADVSDKLLNTRLGRLELAAREAHAEQGLNVLYLAFGFLRWFEADDSGEEVRSPLLLVPVRLHRESVDAEWKLLPEEDETRGNDTLAELMRGQFRLTLPAPGAGQPDPEDEAGWLATHLPAVREAVKAYPRWAVEDRAALGVFNFQKLAMWDDLGRNAERIAAHDLCRAVAGDPGVTLHTPADLPKAEELDDRVPPQEANLILDADSSQQAAVEAVKRGANLVLDGPPGTGKSQTIANLIAEFLAAGKTVLFVSEKTAALDVVKRRLDARGLGDFCLELHSHRANRKAVLAELGRCLTLTPKPFPDPADDLRKLAETRRELNTYVRELHAPRPPLGLTAFQAHGELARLDSLKGRSRVAIPDVRGKDRTYLDHVSAVLARLVDCKPVLADPSRHPWRGCKAAAWSAALRDDVQFHLDRLVKLGGEAVATAGVFAKFGLCPADPTVPGWRAAVSEAKAVLAVPPCPPTWFASDPRAAADAVAKLDAVTRRYREVAATVPEFDPTAVRAADAAELDRASSVGGTGLWPVQSTAGQRPVPPTESVRELGPLLRQLEEKLTALAARARAAQDAARAALQSAKLNVPVPPTADLAALADRLDAVTALGTYPQSWWEPARRKELLAAVGQAAADAATAQKLRAGLAGRVSPAAFDPEHATFVLHAAGFRSLFWRLLLFPGWRSAKAKLAAFYPRGLPPTAELLADLGKLAEYHTLTGAVRNVAAAYPRDLVAADGGPDFAASLARLGTADAALAPFPAAAGRGFTPPDRAALAALRTAADELKAASEAVAEANPPTARPPQELAAWADEQAKRADAARRACDTAVSLLAAGRDLTPADVPAKLRAAAELNRLAAEAGRLTSTIEPGERGVSTPRCDPALIALDTTGGLTPPTRPDDTLLKDWAADRQVAETLLAFLRPRPPLPAALAPAFTDPAARDELARAIQQADATEADGFRDSWAFLAAQLFDQDATVSTGVTLNRLPFSALREWCSARATDADRLLEWLRYADTERELHAAGLATMLDEVRRGEVPVEEATGAVRARFLRLWLDAVYQEVPELRRFSPAEHERQIERFRALDREALAAAPLRTRHALLSSPTRAGLAGDDAPATSELGVLLKEVHKKARHLPLRKLFAQTPTLLPRVKPCLMMSPLAVSTYLQAPEVTFDLVIFDEASQVRPHDAVCAVYRGRQLVVSGDQKQLPPTSFFEREFDAHDDNPDLKDYESVLDVCCTLGLPRRRLRWHYRSRREGLIAFSNHFFYDNQLVTFPSARDADGAPAVGFVRVPDGRFKDGENVPEARVVAGLVFDHFRDHPGQSLGVIAFSQRQQLRILDELEALRKRRPEFEEFFRLDRDAPFFVKNLENVQGDERDVILLSVGYGPDESGKVMMRFGPLNRQGGERRLNVAVTRAKEHVTVVSSMTAGDIDLTRTPAVGARLLKAYLDFAEHGPAALARADADTGPEFDSPFERAVAEELGRQGLTVHRQVGCGGFRIDLAVVDPGRPGRYVLGIECDGYAYHSSATARDRDRLRQAVLEGLGWRICRVWSTDWFRDKAGQVRKVLAAVNESPPLAASPEVAATPQAAEVAPRAADAARVVAGYASIEDVPDEHIRRLLTESLTRFGGTGTEDLVKRVARQLGFKRTGDVIRGRIATVLNDLIATERVRVGGPDDRVWLNPPAP